MAFFERILKRGNQGTYYYGFMFYGLCRNILAKTTVEIGIDDGYISAWLAHAAIENKGIHYAIDNDPIKIDKFKKDINAWNYNSYCKIIRNDSLDINMDLFKNEINFIFLDSIHSYDHVKQELKKYSDYVSINGYLAIHDYNSKDGVKKACDELLKNKSWEKIILQDYNRYNYSNGVLLCRKK